MALKKFDGTRKDLQVGDKCSYPGAEKWEYEVIGIVEADPAMLNVRLATGETIAISRFKDPSPITIWRKTEQGVLEKAKDVAFHAHAKWNSSEINHGNLSVTIVTELANAGLLAKESEFDVEGLRKMILELRDDWQEDSPAEVAYTNVLQMLPLPPKPQPPSPEDIIEEALNQGKHSGGVVADLQRAGWLRDEAVEQES